MCQAAVCQAAVCQAAELSGRSSAASAGLSRAHKKRAPGSERVPGGGKDFANFPGAQMDPNGK